MSTSNQELVTRYIQAMSNGDAQSMKGMLSDNFVCHVNNQALNRDQLLQNLGNVLQKLSAQIVPQEMKSDGDKVNVQLSMSGEVKGPLSLGGLGGKIQFPGTATLRITGGKIAEEWFNFEKPAILQQIGL